MVNQKAENILNLALDTSESEREKSSELNVGYNPIDQEWDLIIKYSGSLEEVNPLTSSVTPLLNEYAIITIRESLIDRLAQLPQVEYIEKPKLLFFQIENGKRVSCINEVQDTRFSLFGQGTLVAVIDSGIDFLREEFRYSDGATRIRGLWDQSSEQGIAPEGYAIGTEYTREQINEAINAETEQERRVIVDSADTSGHGTAVAGIVAGGSSLYQGVAPESELIIVKLGTPRQDSFPRTTELMLGVDYAVRKALEYQMPMAINLSFGNTYGSHDGTSLLERYLDDVANLGRITICAGMGNEGRSGGHTSGKLASGEQANIELAVQERQTSFSIQVWKSYVDEIEISLITPSGVRIGPFQAVLGPQRFTVGQTQILLYYGEPSPYSTNQEIFIDLIPRDMYVAAGVWQIVLSAGKIVNGNYELWLPSENVLNEGTNFLYPTPDTTLTIPSTASRIISVAAYDALTFTYADFSGRGPLAGMSDVQYQKPDLAAPGVNIRVVAAGGGYIEVSGTSFATPFVTGSAALLMEWGIVNGNDPFLYGEKIKAYLRRGARQLPGYDRWPNARLGYGALCVRDSLPV